MKQFLKTDYARSSCKQVANRFREAIKAAGDTPLRREQAEAVIKAIRVSDDSNDYRDRLVVAFNLATHRKG